MDIAELGLSVRSDGVVVASDRLKRFGQDAARAEKATDSLASAFKRFAPIIGAVTAALSVRALKSYADGWSDAQSRIGAAVKNMESAPALMERMVDVANASYSPLAQTVEVYARNVAVLRDLGKGAVEAADFTEALNHALVTTATKGQDADVVLNALSRAISIGGLRAMEYETIMSRSPRVLEAVAKELNTTTTGLRALAQQGKVTGTVIVDGLVKSLEDLRKEAGEMPATIGDAMVRLDTNFGALVGRIDQALGISENFAGTLINVADTMRAWTNNIVQAAIVVQTGFNAAIETASSALSALGGSFDGTSALIIAGAGAAAFAVTALTTAITMGLIKAVAALGLALMANPFALFIGAIAATVTAAYLFRDEIKDIVGIDVVEVMRSAANNTIAFFVGAYNAVVEVWKNLPSAFSAIGKMAWNSFISEFEKPALTVNGMTIIPGLNLSSLKSEITAVEKQVLEPAIGKFKAAFDTDYIDGFASAVGGAWKDAGDAMTKFGEIANNAGKAAPILDPEAAKKAQKLAEAYKQIVDGAQDFVRAQQLEAGLIGLSEQAANALRYEFDLLNEARRAGITLTDADKAGFKALAEAMAEAEEHTRVLTERFEFMKDTIKGFFSDLRKGIEEGKGFWESFADAGVTALQKIADKLIDMALDQMINGVLRNLMQAFNFGGFSFGNTSYFPPAPSGGFHTLAGGGMVSGPGTSISDSIPAWLSDGEFVVRAAAVAQPGVLPLLEAINNGGAAVRMAMGGLARMHAPANTGVQRFAHGGLAQSRPRAQGNAAPSVTVNVQNNTSAQVEVGEPQQNADGSLTIDLIVNELEGRMEASMRGGRLGRATQQTFGLQRRTR